MTNVDLLISKLDRKLRLLHKEHLVGLKTSQNGTLKQQALLEYTQLTATGGIIPIVEFKVLDVLAKHFNLYENDLEHQQILSAMTAELNDSLDRDILASTQTIKNIYPSIYLLTQENFTPTRGSHASAIIRVLKKLEARPRLIIGVIMGFTIFTTTLSNSLNRSLSSNSPNDSQNPQTPSTSVVATSQPNLQSPVPTSNPAQTVASVETPTEQSHPVVAEDSKSTLTTLNYQSQCTLQFNQNQLENIIDNNCSIYQTLDNKNYTLSYANGDIYHIELITDNQAIVNGEQATRIVQKNSSEIAIIFSKGRIGWYLKE